jgi:hypothetical protein
MSTQHLSGIIIAEGDTGIARFWCCVCGHNFRAELARVTMANKQPVCLSCIKKANPQRVKLGMSPIPFAADAYLSD